MATGYSVSAYGAMINCEPRMSNFAEALRNAVTPGCRVVDIGAGPGLFSILACQYGAGSVVAIEPDDSVQLLRNFARDNGFEDRITIVQDLSTNYVPDALADVIISDLHGASPLFEQHILTIVDARRRLLAPGGTLIPARDTIRIALVEDPKYDTNCHQPWAENRFSADLTSARRIVVNQIIKSDISPASLRSAPQDMIVLDYSSVVEADYSAKVELAVQEDCTVNGLLMWFDTDLGHGLGFSNAPDAPTLVYGQLLLPLEQPVQMRAGDHIEADVRAKLGEGGYDWTWISRHVSHGEIRQKFMQSTMLGSVLTSQRLNRRRSTFVPHPGAKLALEQYCMSLIDGRRSLQEIVIEIGTQFPGAFGSTESALDFVANIVERYAATTE